MCLSFTDILELELGYKFNAIQLRQQMRTHKSMGDFNNEKLEFRGDSILDFVLTDWMLTKFPDTVEGGLAKLWDRMAGAKNLARISREIGLDKWIIKKDHVSLSDQVLADTLEAVIGAIYLDGGLEPATLFIHRWITNVIPECTDYKTMLQEKTQAFGYTPVYETIRNVSSQGNKLVFTAKLILPEDFIRKYVENENMSFIPTKTLILFSKIVFAEGFTKKEAEQNVAQKALEVL